MLPFIKHFYSSYGLRRTCLLLFCNLSRETSKLPSSCAYCSSVDIELPFSGYHNVGIGFMEVIGSLLSDLNYDKTYKTLEEVRF
jgi:hypothetical protein